MSDWEEAEELPVVGVAIPAAAGAWDDEDADEGDVKDSWDMDDEEETNGEAATSATAVKPKKKKTLAQRIAERKAEEERKKEEALKANQETEAERREKLRLQVLESDLENSKDLFAGLSLKAPAAATSAFETMDPNTKEEFDAFKDILTSRLSKLEDKAQFPAFVEGLIRDLIVPLQLDDVRKISSTVTAMVNEKQKAQKDTGKKKKSAKASIKTVSRGGGVDTTDYGDVYDEFADFI